jgi:sporulation protein YlmC with PRC-barrel domain
MTIVADWPGVPSHGPSVGLWIRYICKRPPVRFIHAQGNAQHKVTKQRSNTMTRTRHLSTYLAAATLAATLGLTAQAQMPDREYQNRSDQKTDQKKLELRRASKIVGSHVIGSDNEKLGIINNLAIDLDSGRAIFAVVSTGGVMGVGDKLTAVPFKALHFSDINEPVKVNVTKASFDAVPKMDKDAWNNMKDRTWRSTIYQHYSLDPNWDAPLDLRTGEKKVTKETTTHAMNIVKSSEAIGMDVRNAQHEDLGDVNDLVIDVNRCQVAYTVLGFGGVLGVGEKLFAIPWQSLKLDRADNRFVLNIDKERLRNAPGFDRDKWPDMTEPAWSQRVYAFYGAEPDWVYGFAGQGNVHPDTTAYKGWETGSEYNRLFNAGTVQTVTGTISDIDYTSPMRGMSEGYILNVKTSDNQTIDVHLGPRSFVESKGVRFNEGEQVTVTGSKCTINGKQCILAAEVRSGTQSLTLRQKDGTPMWPTSSRTPSAPDRP